MSKKKAKTRGWALLETAIVTMLLAVIAIATVSTLRGGGRARNSSQPLAVLTQAQQTLVGYALAHRQFPPPDEAVKSSERPGYLEGWLPEKELGFAAGGEKIRYLVLATLAAPPAIHNADPIGLTNGLVSLRTRPTSIDFCASLLQSEISKKSLKNNSRTAFALQQARDLKNGSLVPLGHMWLRDMSLPDLPRDVMLHTVQRGFTEIAAQLGCFERLDALSSDVKFAGALEDMRLLANQEVLRNQLALRRLNNSIENYEWRLSNMSMQFAISTVRLILLILRGGPAAAAAVRDRIHSPIAVNPIVGRVGAMFDAASSAAKPTVTAFAWGDIANAVDLSINIAELTGHISEVSDSLHEALASVSAAEDSVLAAKKYVEQLSKEKENYINAANQNQFLGEVR